MGNLAAKCFQDVPEMPNERHPNQVSTNSNISYNDLTLPQISPQQQFLQQQTSLDCKFCSNHFQLIRSEQFNLENPNTQQRRSHQPQIDVNVEFTEPLAILHNDPIANYTSSWFQLALALPKYQKRRDHYEGKQEQMYFDQSKIPLLDADLYALICLRWCVVDYFRGLKLQPQHQLLKQCCELFAKITHISQFYQEIFLTNYKQQEYAYNIKLYVYLYHKFQKIMNYHNCKYEVLGDLIQNLYKDYFDFKNVEEIPHIKLIGYMMRIWCQTMLTEEVQKVLLDSYRNFHWKNDFQLIYDYINSIIDANLNECNIHWIGHRDYFLFDNKMIDQNPNPLEKFIDDLNISNSQDFYQNIDKKLSEFQFAYPTWYFEIEFKELAIKHKIARLIKEVKNQKNQTMIRIKKAINTSSEFSNQNSLNLILNTADTLFNQSQEEQSEYIMALLIQESNFCDLIPRSKIKRNPTASTIDSLSGLKANNSSLKVSDEAIQITKEVDVEYKKQLQIFQDELREVQMKITKREFILSQRAENLRIKANRQIEWFNYFQRMDLSKVPEQGIKLKECFKTILRELMQQDFNYYSIQLLKIEESI